MPDEMWMQLGVGGILIAWFLKQMFEFLKMIWPKRTGNGKDTERATQLSSYDTHRLIKEIHKDSMETRRLVEKIYEMHNKTDEDGVYVWYVKASLGRSVDKLASAVEDLAREE